MKIVELRGDTRPAICGVEEFARGLDAKLQDAQVEVEVLELDAWGIGSVGAMLRKAIVMRPDVLFMQYPSEAFGSALGPICFAAVQRIAPLVVALHEYTQAHPLRRAAMLGLCARADFTVFTTPAERDAVLKRLRKLGASSSVVPITSSISSHHWAPSDRFDVGYFGQIRPKKGLEVFLDLAKEARAAAIPCSFVLIGSKTARFAEYYSGIIERAEALGVEIHLDADNDRAAELLSSLSLCYLPFPDGATLRRSTLLAALNCHVPVVTRVTEETPPSLAACVTDAADTYKALDILSRTATSLSGAQALRKDDAVQSLETQWPRITEQYAGVFRGVSRQLR